MQGSQNTFFGVHCVCIFCCWKQYGVCIVTTKETKDNFTWSLFDATTISLAQTQLMWHFVLGNICCRTRGGSHPSRRSISTVLMLIRNYGGVWHTLKFFECWVHSGIRCAGQMADGGDCGLGCQTTRKCPCSVAAFDMLHVCTQPLKEPRLRAAVFINACAMQEAVTLRQGFALTAKNLRKLETANYLFHSSINWFLVGVCLKHVLFYIGAQHDVGVVNTKGLPKRLYCMGSVCGRCDQNYTRSLVVWYWTFFWLVTVT